MARMNWSLRDLYRTLDAPGSNPLRRRPRPPRHRRPRRLRHAQGRRYPRLPPNSQPILRRQGSRRRKDHPAGPATAGGGAGGVCDQRLHLRRPVASVYDRR